MELNAVHTGSLSDNSALYELLYEFFTFFSSKSAGHFLYNAAGDSTGSYDLLAAEEEAESLTARMMEL